MYQRSWCGIYEKINLQNDEHVCFEVIRIYLLLLFFNFYCTLEFYNINFYKILIIVNRKMCVQCAACPKKFCSCCCNFTKYFKNKKPKNVNLRVLRKKQCYFSITARGIIYNLGYT